MFETTVINIRHARQYPNAVYIGRAGKGQDGYFGNEHPIGWCVKCGTKHDRAQCVDAFKKDFLIRLEQDREYRFRVLALKGKELMCFCAPELCHGHVIAEWLDANTCKGCMGTRNVPFNRHGTLEQCGRCKGTGVEPGDPGSEYWWLNAQIYGARGVLDSILRLFEIGAISRSKAGELINFAQPDRMLRFRQDQKDYLPLWPNAPWDKLDWGD